MTVKAVLSSDGRIAMDPGGQPEPFAPTTLTVIAPGGGADGAARADAGTARVASIAAPAVMMRNMITPDEEVTDTTVRIAIGTNSDGTYRVPVPQLNLAAKSSADRYRTFGRYFS